MSNAKFLRRFRHQSSLLDKSGELDVSSSRPVNFLIQPGFPPIPPSLHSSRSPAPPTRSHKPRIRPIHISCKDFPYASAHSSQVSPSIPSSQRASPYQQFLPALSPRQRFVSPHRSGITPNRRYVSGLRPRVQSIAL